MVGTTAHPPATGDLNAQKQAIRLQGIPTRYRAVFKRAYGGKSLRAAVSAFCLDCIGFRHFDPGASNINALLAGMEAR